MNLKFTSLFKAYLVLLICNLNLVHGKKKKEPVREPSGSGEIEEWAPEAASVDLEENLHTSPNSIKNIDFRGLLRGSFALHLALGEPTKNSVCSPISALLPLGKLVLGAKGKAEEELLKAIGHNREELKPALKELIESLKQLPGVTLAVASRIYIPKQARLNPHFTKASKQIFHSAIEKTDFSNPAESASNINSWVKSHTNGMIPNLLSPSDLAGNPSLVLVNAVYFQGNWMKPFGPAGTAPFSSPMGTRRVPMMTVTGTYSYVKDEALNAEILDLPYANKNASFVVVLPIDKNGLPMLLTALKLAPKMLNKALKEMQRKTVQVDLPKFKIRSKIDLKELFEKFGLSRIFKKNKDLSDIVVNDSVHVTSALQEAVMEVTETGTEAAGASAVIAHKIARPMTDIHFTADHPFLFYVLFQGHQLFAGTYTSV